MCWVGGGVNMATVAAILKLGLYPLKQFGCHHWSEQACEVSTISVQHTIDARETSNNISSFDSVS